MWRPLQGFVSRRLQLQRTAWSHAMGGRQLQWGRAPAAAIVWHVGCCAQRDLCQQLPGGICMQYAQLMC
jgi:hypothetical protein